jgi:hypothetical protein
MPLNQAEFLRARAQFEADLAKTNEALYKALKKPVSPERREEIIQAARRKLAEYDGLLAQLTEPQRRQISGSFDREIGEIRDQLHELTEQRAP